MSRRIAKAELTVGEWRAGSWRTEIDRLSASPEVVQHRTLMRILKAQATTPYGERHGFGGIESVAAFRRQVPLNTSHTLRAQIELQREQGMLLLSAEAPVTYLAGSTPGRIVPVTGSDLTQRRDFAGFLEEELADATGCFTGQTIDLSDLDDLYGVQKAPLAYGEQLAGSPDLSGIDDLELRAYLVALKALAGLQVTALHAPQIGSVLRLLDVIRRHRLSLLGDLTGDSLSVAHRLPDDLAAHYEVQPSPARIRQLRTVLSGRTEITAAALWPALKCILTDASRHHDDDVRAVGDLLPETVAIIDMGCWLNEAVLTLPEQIGSANGVPAAHHVFFEFAEPRTDRLLGLHQITEGVAYRVHVTTQSGLYRFALPVIAEVGGWSGSWPLLRVRRVTGLSGGRRADMPTLAQACLAARQAMDAAGLGAPFCRVSPGGAAGTFIIHPGGVPVTPGLMERLRILFDHHLRSISLYYDRLRADGVLPPVSVAQPETVGRKQVA